MIKVDQLSDGSFEISWDPNDPVEQQLNSWTKERFIEAIQEKVNELQCIEEEYWIFMAAEYYATGEGKTVCLMMTQAVPSELEDFGPDRSILTTQEHRARRKFEKTFGDWMTKGLDILDRKTFFDKYKQFLPEVLHKIKDDNCYIEYYSELHFNYS